MNISEQSPAFIRSLCRTCMNANATVDVARNTSIFKQYLYEKPTAGKVSQFSLLELLQSVRPDIYSQHEDKLPQVMCLRCIDQLQAAHEYLKMCQESERQFRKLLLPKTTAATSTPVHRAAPPEKEYITDHHVISANVDYPLTVVKEETMDCNAYSQFEISMDKGEHSLMDKESLPSTSGMNDHERFPSCGQSEESEDGGDGGDESWRPPAKRNHQWLLQNRMQQMANTVNTGQCPIKKEPPEQHLVRGPNLATEPRIPSRREENLNSTDDQLYGPDYEENMICIGGDVYCRKIIYEMALSSTQKASRVARKLLEGVFKKDFLLKATLTGQSPRAQGLERQQEPVIPLCYKARTAIIDFSIRLAQQRGWEPQNLKEIERAMSQRLGEIKRQNLQISPLVRNSDEQIQLPPNFDRW